MSSRPPERPTAGLFIAVLGSELMLALSFLRVWGDASSTVSRGRVLDAALDQPFWGTALSRHIVTFVATLVLLHFALGLTAWTLGKLTQLAWPRSRNSLRTWSLLWLVLLAMWILGANAAWFPASSLGSAYATAMAAAWYGVTPFHVLTAGVGTLLCCTLIRCALAWFRSLRHPTVWLTSSAAASTAIAAFAAFAVSSIEEPASTPAHPHVILIGLDSLRPDALHGSNGEDWAPTINEFIAQSTLLPDTLTPLARTFPAWVSILSGKHPHTTGAVINLLPREFIDEGDTLPRLLRDSGYHSVYATDEVRFSYIDETYGFDEVISPPKGAADFVLATASDTPLANLFVNTWLGELLFPYAYANRAYEVTYNPDTFIDWLDERLSFTEPTFLAVHLTLSHWPYTWATAPLDKAASSASTLPDRYRQSVPRLDEQFADLLQLLRAKGALNNALVVVLSDHGEALGEPLPISDDAHAKRHIRALALPFGHGTNVFAEAQYRVLLALRSFGPTNLQAQPGTVLDVPASLEDLAPTLADALDIAPRRPFDGLSWLPQLQGDEVGHRGERVRYLESEFVPPGFEAGLVMSPSALESASTYYRIDPQTDRALIRAERLEEILASRQYAATQGDRLLVAIPSDTKTEQHVVFLAHPLAKPTWLHTPPAPGEAGHDLWTALHARYEPVRNRPVTPPLGHVD